MKLPRLPKMYSFVNNCFLLLISYIYPALAPLVVGKRSKAQILAITLRLKKVPCIY